MLQAVTLFNIAVFGLGVTVSVSVDLLRQGGYSNSLEYPSYEFFRQFYNIIKYAEKENRYLIDCDCAADNYGAAFSRFAE